jgi:peptidoglycan-N-acetylglucosamine deacetylase
MATERFDPRLSAAAMSKSTKHSKSSAAKDPYLRGKRQNVCTFVAGFLLMSTFHIHAQQIAVTFDDLPAHGPMPPETSRLVIIRSILSTLKQKELPPSFGFINGAQVAQDPSLGAVLAEWRAAGNFLGNHTWAHVDINKQTSKEFEQDVIRNEALLQTLMGAADWRWLRFPYLDEGDPPERRRAIRNWLYDRGYGIATVSMDFDDSMWNAPYARCAARHDEASIRRLHDGFLAAANLQFDHLRTISHEIYNRDIKYVLLLHVGAFDAKLLPELLELYERKGAKFISMRDALSDDAYLSNSANNESNAATRLDLMLARSDLKSATTTDYEKDLDGMCRSWWDWRTILNAIL